MKTAHALPGLFAFLPLLAFAQGFPDPFADMSIIDLEPPAVEQPKAPERKAAPAADAPAKAAPPAAPRPRTWGEGVDDWTRPVPDWQPIAADEHPRLVFRRGDVEELRRRAKTPEGKIILRRLQDILEGPFTLWHPAGHGLLFQISGDQKHADTAREQVERILKEGLKDKDDRYGFRNPGGGGPMRAGPAIGAMGLAYDLAGAGWETGFRVLVARAILDNPFTASIAKGGPLGPSVNHYGAAVGGVGLGLLAIRGDHGVDAAKLEPLLQRIFEQTREEIARGHGERGYYFEGHQCGRISSNTGILPFLAASANAAGLDLVSGSDNARWLSAKWIYEFSLNPDKSYTNPQRGMYCRTFPRGGMISQVGDFAFGFAVCPPEYIPALKWVYENQVEPGPVKTFDVIEYPHTAIFALAHWPLDTPAENPEAKPELFPRVLRDRGPGYYIFRNGWSGEGKDIVVNVLLGSSQNGRGMASGGSVYVTGKGLGWSEPHATYRFPGIFYGSTPVFEEFQADGSGVLSAITPAKVNKFNLDVALTREQATSLAVDFSGKSGAEALVAMVGPLTGHQVEYWMDIKAATPKDVEGQDGYATRTTAIELGGQKGYVMTLQKGEAPGVIQEAGLVRVGQRILRFDGTRLFLE